MARPNKRVRQAGVNEKAKMDGAAKRVHITSPDMATVSGQLADSTMVMTFQTGPYAYLSWQFSLTSNVEVTGETYQLGGVHYVKTEFISKYVKNITAQADGVTFRKITMAQQIQLNASKGLGAQDGTVYMIYGGPHEFKDPRVEDVFMLGTSDVSQLRVLFDLTSDWVNGQFNLTVLSEYAPISKPLGYVQTYVSQRYDLSAAGEHLITDLPVYDDISRIYIWGSNISDFEFNYDNQAVYKGNVMSQLAHNKAWGTSVDALGDCILIDFMRSEENWVNLQGLRSDAQRKRNARASLKLEMLTADNEVQVMIENSGRWGLLR